MERGADPCQPGLHVGELPPGGRQAPAAVPGAGGPQPAAPGRRGGARRGHHRGPAAGAAGTGPGADRGQGSGPGPAVVPGYRRLPVRPDRKSTRLNSSHVEISYAVFCLKKKKRKAIQLFFIKKKKKTKNKK